MIPPSMVSAMGGDSLVVPATLQITDAGGHALPVSGAIFISITRWDKGTGAVRRTKQMAYLCVKTRDLVLSREAMTVLGMVAASINNAASVRQILGCTMPSSARGVEGDVTGGQLTLDLLASHNQSHPSMQVSPNDLLPSPDPDHLCRGTIPLKNGMLPCGCPARAEPPEPLTHN